MSQWRNVSPPLLVGLLSSSQFPPSADCDEISSPDEKDPPQRQAIVLKHSQLSHVMTCAPQGTHSNANKTFPQCLRLINFEASLKNRFITYTTFTTWFPRRMFEPRRSHVCTRLIVASAQLFLSQLSFFFKHTLTPWHKHFKQLSTWRHHSPKWISYQFAPNNFHKRLNWHFGVTCRNIFFFILSPGSITKTRISSLSTFLC